MVPPRCALLLALLAMGCARPAPTPAPVEAAATADADADPSWVPADSVRADAEVLYATLRAAHYDLFAHTDQATYDAAYDALLAGIDGPMPRLEATRRLMAFVALGRVGHARVDFPVAAYIEHVSTGGTVLPFDVQVTPDGVLLAHSYHPELPVGATLVALDGEPADVWLERLGTYVSAEHTYLRDAQLETMFPRLHWLHGASAPSHTLQIEVDGTPRTVTVDERPGIEVETAKSTWEAAGQVREARTLDGGIGYLRPGPFYAMHPDESLDDVVAFIDGAFRGFLDDGVHTVVLDLRDNPGGDNRFSDPMVAWVADAPFAFASTYRVRASETTRGVLAGLAEADPDGLSAQMAEVMAGHADGETFAFPIPATEPREQGFDGEVWALVNRHSYSNATCTAAILKDHGFARLAGEPTADLPTSYASSAQFPLPGLGLTVTYPKAWFARPSGEDTGHGVVPDLVLPMPAPGDAGDPTLDALLEHLRAGRSP